MSIDPFTSLNPSYCFVDMLSPADAQQALKILPGKLLYNRPIKVKPCTPKQSVGPTSLLGLTRWKDRSEQHQDEPTCAADLLIPIHENRRLYIGGLPRPTDNHNTDLEIRDIFNDFVVKAVSKVQWPVKESMQGYGWYAFVDVESAEEGRRAIAQLNNTKRWGGVITVGLAGGVPSKVLRTAVEEESRKVGEARETSKDSKMKMSWRRPNLS
jgi:RNA recognition motif-containing protein